jgi:transposase-like protein
MINNSKEISQLGVATSQQDGAPRAPLPGTRLRGRAGRRSVEERSQAVLELLSGKASIQQLAIRFCVNEETIVKWRDDALEGMAGSLRRGTGKSASEQKLEKEYQSLKAAFTEMAIKNELMERALRDRPPIRRGRSAK